MTVQSALMEGIQSLKAVGIESAARDARLLMASALGIDASRLTLCLHDPISAHTRLTFDEYIRARQTHRPVSRILGRREFWGRSFIITDDVLDPRGDTETLIAKALTYTGDRILDLGTGSGIIAITMAAERATATVHAIDISNEALNVARENASIHGVADRVCFTQGSWFDPVEDQFDMILSNPPYISDTEMRHLSPDVAQFDPHIALTPGGDGLAPYRIIAQHANRYLKDDGVVIVEIGHTQAQDVTNIFRAAGFCNVLTHKDFEQKDRIIVAQK